MGCDQRARVGITLGADVLRAALTRGACVEGFEHDVHDPLGCEHVATADRSCGRRGEERLARNVDYRPN